MSEMNKTLSFVGAAAALVLAAFLVRPTPVVEAQQDLGKEFFPEFKDATDAASLEIVEYDGRLHPFKVAQHNGVWSIESRQNYPADAEKQLAAAALALKDLRKLQDVSDSKADHEKFGVVDPNPEKLDPGAAGVGKRVALTDKSGKKLAELIIGKKDTEKPDLYYVRIPEQDRVYRAQLKTDALSTQFHKWIERDLLKMQEFNLKEVVFDDHKIEESRQGIALVSRGLAIVDYDNKTSKWTLESLLKVDRKTGKSIEVKPPEGEELDSQKLNDMRHALSDLKIEDVAHKPAGLSRDLRATDQLPTDEAAREALERKGFFLAPTASGVEVFSNEGEVRCGLTDGVEYVLRFGAIAGRSRDDGEEEHADGEDGADAKKSAGVDRYIMITTRFREDLIPKPELTPLPEGSEGTELPATGAAPATDGATVSPRADETLLAVADDARPTELAQAVKNSPRGGAAKAGEKAAPAIAPKEEAPAAPAAAEEKPAAEEKSPAEVDPDAAAEAAEKARVARDMARKHIEADNKRKQDDYQKKVEDGQKRVAELNERFADWYYVISDQTYQKIHINTDQLFKKKPEAEGDKAAAPDAAKGLPKTPAKTPGKAPAKKGR